MTDPQRPLIPQFSLRWVLVATAVLAVISLVVSQALRGVAWAGGVSIALGALILAFVVYAALFAVAWLTARITSARRLRRAARQGLSADRAATTKADSPTTVAVVLALGLSALISQTSWAASGGSVMYPVLGPNQANTTGLTLTLDTSWVDCPGYRPVTVEVKSIAGPLTADRVLTIEFRASQSQMDSNSTAVSQVIELPEGSTSAKATLAVPQRQPWSVCEWDVYEDGRRVKQLSSGGRVYFTGANNSYFADGAPPTVLALSGHNQISVNHLTVFGQTDASVIFVGQPTSAASMSVQPRIGGPAAIPSGIAGIPTLADLPTRWIDYSGIDIVLSSFDALQTLADKHPPQWQAIRKWLRGGGTLVVYGLGNDWTEASKNKLPQLDLLTDSATTQISDDPTQRGWVLPPEAIRDLPLNGADGTLPAATTDQDGISELGRKLLSTELLSNQGVTLSSAPFVVRPCGYGMVAAIRSDNNFTGTTFPWTWFYNTLGPERWQWFQRYGVSMTRPNPDFWNFAIPGVGAAPVTEFQVLITLFVVAIGPVNYYLLRRAGKLNLMVISVPLCAAVVTGALFLYALMADGLGVRLRARSLTHIDQRSGEASCWARLSYYAGLTPSGGLKFSDQTVVLPFQAEPSAYGEGAPRELDWLRIDRSNPASPLEQRLTSGWLYARTPTQMMTVRARKTVAKLGVNQASGQTPKVTNELGGAIRCVVLIDEQSKCFTGTQIDAGQSATLTPATSQSAAAAALIEPLMVAGEPRVEIQQDRGGSGFFGVRRYQRRAAYTNYNSGNVNAAQQNTGVLEQSLRKLRQQLTDNSLPPRSYVAIVETSPEMELGTPSAREEAGLHVVFGEW